MNARDRAVQFTLALTLLATPLVHADTMVFSYPFSGSGRDQLFRGFYLSSFDGTNLSTVTLAYNTRDPGIYSTSLTARIGAYDGLIIGTATLTSDITADPSSGEDLVTYSFGGAPVPFGS